MPPTTQPQALDPQIVNLAKAIRQTESNNNFTAPGKSGEYGAYQFLPSTWDATAPKYGVNVPLTQATPQQQNEVAYKQLAEWKTQHPDWNVGNFASAWNAGPGKPNAYQEGNVGTNAEGVSYDTPTYAKNVATAYQQFKNGITPPTPEAPPSVGGFIGNTVKSGANFAGNIIEAAIHPIQTIQNIGGAVSGGLQELGGQQNAQTAQFDNVVNYFKQRYGSVDGLLHTAYTDPVGLAADIASVAGVGAGAAGIAGKAAELGTTADATRASELFGETGVRTMAGDAASGNALTRGASAVQKALTSVSNVTNPLTPIIGGAGKLAGGTSGDIATEIGTQLTGLEPKTIQEIVANPQSFTPEQIANTTRISVAKQVEDALQAKMSSVDEAGAAYKPVRDSSVKVPVSRNFLEDQLRKEAKVDVVDGEIVAKGSSKVRASKDVKALQNVFDTWKPEFNKGFLSPEEFLNFRQDLAAAAKYDREFSASKPVEFVAAGIRTAFNNAYRDKIPSLQAMDENFSSQLEALQRLRKGFIDKDGNLTDTAISKIANAGNKNEALARLEEIVPGITQKLKVLKAIEDIQKTMGTKVGTYPSAFLKAGGVIAGAVSGRLDVMAAALATTIVASPDVAVPLLRVFGNNKGLVSGVLAHLAKFATISATANRIADPTQASEPQTQPQNPQTTVAEASPSGA